MYTNKTSAKLTFAVTVIFLILLPVLMIFGWDILEWWYGTVMLERTVKIVMYTFYSCCPMAFCALGCVLKLLKNIFNENIFSENTVSLLRIISWCCALVTVVCAVAGYFYAAFLVFGLGSAFMTVILRVLKNVLQAAVLIKEENELTV